MKWLFIVMGVFVIYTAGGYNDGTWWHSLVMATGGVATLIIGILEVKNG